MFPDPALKAPSDATMNSSSRLVHLPDLCSSAVRGLVPMFDNERQLFCHRYVRQGESLVCEGVSRRYTIMTLLGLHELEKAGGASPFDVRKITGQLSSDVGWIDNIGDLGLLLWLDALVVPGRQPKWCTSAGLESALLRYSDARACKTMELSWFITGLAHQFIAGRRTATKFADIAIKAYDKLVENQGPSGLFGHLGRQTVFGRLRGRIGSFADQVYPIYALTRLAQACDVREPLKRAVECARGICRVQGPQGQWWWHYDSAGGRVVRKYPVFSVHQHGMGPFALFAISQASREDFTASISKGLQWVSGENELGEDLRESSPELIWRCIQPGKKYTMYVEDILDVVGVRVNLSRSDNYSVLPECRPYELGWLLYALAPVAGMHSPAGTHAVQPHLQVM